MSITTWMIVGAFIAIVVAWVKWGPTPDGRPNPYLVIDEILAFGDGADALYQFQHSDWNEKTLYANSVDAHTVLQLYDLLPVDDAMKRAIRTTVKTVNI